MTNHTQFPDHYALAFPCKRAAALIYTALEVLGPEDAPDHDATAVEHLRLALLILGRPRDWLHPGGDLTLRALAPLLSQPIRAGRRVCPNHGLCFDRAGRQVARSEAELQRLERVIVLTGDPRNQILR